MISRCEDYVEYCRETAQNLRRLEDLALRGRNTRAITLRVNARIVRDLHLSSNDTLVDIGCGDGTLLRLAQERGVSDAIGLLATDEEVDVVRRHGLRVRQGFTHNLPVPDASASVVVCNNVLLVVPRERILESLREIERIAKPQARIFLGEIPFVPGPEPEPAFSTARETLEYLYRRHGLRSALGMARRMARWRFTGEPMVIRGGASVSFYARPDEFIALAEEAGLELVRYWPHDDWPQGRYNYLFRKGGNSAHSESVFEQRGDVLNELMTISDCPPSVEAPDSSAGSPW